VFLGWKRIAFSECVFFHLIKLLMPLMAPSKPLMINGKKDLVSGLELIAFRQSSFLAIAQPLFAIDRNSMWKVRPFFCSVDGFWRCANNGENRRYFSLRPRVFRRWKCSSFVSRDKSLAIAVEAMRRSASGSGWPSVFNLQ
jgi:hypothetical protein